MTLPESHRIILSALTAESFLEVLNDDEVQMTYVLQGQVALILDGSHLKTVADDAANLPTVKQLREKAEKGAPISVVELEQCISDITGINTFLGWAYDDGSSKLKSLLRSNSRGAPRQPGE